MGGGDDDASDVSVMRQPWRALPLAVAELGRLAGAWARWMLLHPGVWFGLVPLLLLHVLMSRVVQSALFVEAERLGLAALWWVGLGVLSSVGLGSGMHTGLLFAFPHILQVSLAAYACGHMDFSATRDVWFAPAASAFVCRSPAIEGASVASVAVLDVCFKALPAILLWGAGTALGELPPFLLARAGRSASLRESETAVSGSESASGWMEGLMRGAAMRFGLWGVVAMSAWPNALFDVLGMAAGAGKSRRN